MPDADNRQNPSAPVKTPGKGRGWTRFISNVKRKMHDRHAKKQEESPVDRAARRTANATIWLAVVTVVLAGVSVLTLRILNRQLGEMQGSGKQTDKLICLYQKQVGQLAKQAKDTHALAIAAEKQAKQALAQANATNRLATASLAANRLTEESVRGKIAIYSKLLNPIQAGQQLGVSVDFRNVGNSAVAIRSQTGTDEWQDLPDGDMPIKLPGKEEREILQPGDKSTVFFYPKVLDQPDVYWIDTGNKSPFFFGKVAYETLGKEHTIEFCFYVLAMHSPRKGMPGSEIDPLHTLMQCNKWHKQD